MLETQSLIANNLLLKHYRPKYFDILHLVSPKKEHFFHITNAGRVSENYSGE